VRCEPLLIRQIDHGRIVADRPNLTAIRERALANLDRLDETYTRIINPHIYKVSVSRALRTLKQEFLARYLADDEVGE
jgi:nicotinate phosphoribosyltransferase